MKSVFSKFGKLHRSRWLALVAGLMLVPVVGKATDSGYTNSTTIALDSLTYTNTVSYLPNIDATNFVNTGIWDIYTFYPGQVVILSSQSGSGVGTYANDNTVIPYATANTLNFTNTGTMIGSVGWEFDRGTSDTGSWGGRSMASSFYNSSRGTIAAVDGAVNNPEIPGAVSLVSGLLISATNIVNKGTLIAGTGGRMVLNGTNVDLARSRLEISSITPEGSASTPTNFYPDTAIYDEYWQQTDTLLDGKTPYSFDSSQLWSGLQVMSGSYDAYGLCQVVVSGQLGFYPIWADSTNITSDMYMTNVVYTNADQSVVTTNVPSKIFRQGVFIAVGDTNIIPDDRFFPDSDNISNLFQGVTVKLTSALNGNALYLEDNLASQTNRGLAVNLAGNNGNNPLSPCTDPTYRPANYTFSRLDTGAFAFGSPGGGPPTNTFFYDPATFSNKVVKADYSFYGAYADNLVSDPYNASVTNLPGRIEINAGNLDLSKATIANQGAEVVIKADNFLGSTGAVVSCENLSYNLGMTNAPGLVNVKNLAAITNLPGMNGIVYAWSAVWTNGMNTAYTNWTTITNSDGSSTTTNNVFTNTTEMDFHVLIVDARLLSATVPETVQDLILQTNTVVSDSMNVVHSFLFNGQRLTLDGTLNLSGPNLQNWSRTLAPNLRYFTNNGSLSIPQEAHFGDDEPTGYAAFVNSGSISVGGSETINCDFYLSGGSQNAPSGYFATISKGKLENAGISSGQDIDFTGGTLKLDNSMLSAGNRLNFNLTNDLYDSGGSAGNQLTCGDGFNLPVKPAAGDLLGTAITSQAYNGAEVDTVWAGDDRGATPAGYSNNVALGQLTLSPQGAAAFPPLFYFAGTGATNALYVDLLDLSQITNLTEMLETDPNLVIYYAAAKLPSEITVLNANGVPVEEVETNNPLNGQTYYLVANGGGGQIPQEAEEVLNGQLGGHLRWVSGFAGPNSSVDVIINGKTYSVNRALRYSLIIDSNGDGIPNGVDPNPFGTPPLLVSGAILPTNTPPDKSFAISWTAVTNVVYHVEYSTNLTSTNWLPLLNYTNTAATNRVVTVYDTNAVSRQRFYRVSHP